MSSSYDIRAFKVLASALRRLLRLPAPFPKKAIGGGGAVAGTQLLFAVEVLHLIAGVAASQGA